MKKLYISSVLLLVSLLLIGSVAWGQGTPTYSYSLGAGGNAFPLQTTTSNRVQNLYTPSMFPGTITGNITKIYIMANSATAGGVFSDLNVSIGNTTQTQLISGGAFTTGLTTVYSATSVSYPALAAGDWFSITLQTPFLYSGSSNFIVDVSQSSYTGSGIQVRYDATIAGGRMWGAITSTSNSAGPGPFNLGFDMVPSAPCTSPPTAGTTSLSATNLCSASPLVLNLTGASYGSGQSYQWQTSTTGTSAGPWTNLGAPSVLTPYYATTATGTLYYRAAVTCGTSTTYSTPAQVSVPSLFPGGTYTINGANPASSTNFQTFAAAVSAIGCGTSGPVVFNVAPGTYTEQITIPQINTNSATNNITFNGSTTGTTLTYAATLATAPHTLLLNGSDYFSFNNINFVSSGASYGLPAHLYNGADYNSFTNCTFNCPLTSTSSTFCPFSISGSATSATTGGLAGNNNTITGCTMNGGYYNIGIYGATNTPATNNSFIGCNFLDFYYYGFYSWYTDGLTLSGNNMERSTRATVSGCYGFYIYYPTRLLFEKNRIHDLYALTPTSTGSSYCIYMPTSLSTTATQNRIINNFIYNIRCNGTIYGMYINGANKVYHNSVVIDDATATGTGTVYGIYDYDYTNGGVGTDIRNNIIHVSRGGTGTKYLLYYYYNSQALSNNNDLYMASTAGTTNKVGYFYSAASNGTYTTLADWQTANGGAFDATSYSADPLYTNLAVGNGKPTNLALDNKGLNLGVLTDITNFVRILPTPDIGAYEFGSNCPNVANTVASSVTGTTARITWSRPAGTLGYEYVLDTTSAEPLTAGTVLADTFLNAANLQPLTTYRFYVRSKCDVGGYSYWTSITFSTPCYVSPAPISVRGDTLICQNHPTRLTGVTAPKVLYQWNLNGTPIQGANTVDYYAAANGRYTLTTTMGSCTNTTPPITIRVDSALIAYATSSGNTSLCLGTGVTLTANSGNGFSYRWLKNGVVIPGATAMTYLAEYNGTYQVEVSRSGATCAPYSDAITVVINNRPVPQIMRSGNVLSTTATYNTYQWYKGVTAIAGATSSTYTFTHDGTYSVAVNDTNGCAGQSSGYVVNFLGISQVKGSDVTVFPNPAYDQVTIASPVPVNVSIQSVDGRKVMYQENAKSIDIHTLSSGIYLLHITDKDNNVIKTEKLIKQAH